jgi:hypothetical protein
MAAPDLHKPAIFGISALAGRVSGAGLCSPFSNFHFGGAETGSIADGDRFAERMVKENRDRASLADEAHEADADLSRELSPIKYQHLVPRKDFSLFMRQPTTLSTSNAISPQQERTGAFRASALQTWNDVVAAA